MRLDPAPVSGAAAPRPAPVRRAGLMQRVGLALVRWREAGIVAAGMLLIVYFQSANAAFLSGDNVGNLVDYTATTAIIAATKRSSS